MTPRGFSEAQEVQGAEYQVAAKAFHDPSVEPAVPLLGHLHQVAVMATTLKTTHY
jgi:hypothetical protein